VENITLSERGPERTVESAFEVEHAFEGHDVSEQIPEKGRVFCEQTP